MEQAPHFPSAQRSRRRSLSPTTEAVRKLLAWTCVGVTLATSAPAFGGPQIAGSFHTAWVQPSGDLLVWGNNSAGQIGDGTTASRTTPVRIISHARAVATGGFHTLVIRTDGTLWSWGDNTAGQLGTGGTLPRTIPAKVMDNVQAVAAGNDFSLAIRTDGTLWAWGGNAKGQLGLGTTADRRTPVLVMSGVVSIAAGQAFAMAVKVDGSLWTWGDNSQGQLGDNTAVSTRATPLQIATGVQDVAAGTFHGLAVKTNATLWTWGLNASGQLGDGSTSSRRIPTQVLSGVRAASGGRDHSMALKTDGTVWTMGDNNGGQLGDGTTVARTIPIQVAQGMQSIGAGQFSSAAIRSDGALLLWGSNVFGQLGDGSTLTRHTPVPVFNGATVTATGVGHTLALKADGTLWAWGDNEDRQLGPATAEFSRAIPVQVMTNVQAIAAGGFHSLALKIDGTVWAWGANVEGQLGDGTQVGRATPVQVFSGVRAVAAGYDFSFVIRNDGSLWAWGNNAFGQLGDGTTTRRLSPVLVLAGIQSVSAGSTHTLALKSDGTMYAWGNNEFGQFGDGTTESRPLPRAYFTGVQAIAAGGRHSMALSGGVAFVWGSNQFGQVGDGSLQNRNEPVAVMIGIKEVAGSLFSSFALGLDGTFWQWGQNYDGILGPYATGGSQLTPLKDLFIRNVTKLGISSATYVAVNVINTSGAVLARGGNAVQQLGITRTMYSTTAIPLRDPAASFAGTDLVVEYFNPTIRNAAGVVGIGHYFFTAATPEADSIDDGGSGPGWARTKRTFRAWNDLTKAPPGAIGVCRFYAATPNSHFYTASAQECQSLRNLNPANNATLGWAYEGIAFYTVAPAGGACPAGYQPVYRSYNNRALQLDSNHRVTPSYNDYYRSIRFFGYADEGVALCSPTSTQPGGDLQVTYAYPGPIVQSGAPIALEFQFSNNGPGRADGGTIHVALAPEVANWFVSCTARVGAICPGGGSLSAEQLRTGVAVSTWPAGGGFKLTMTGTAPQVAAGANAGLLFGASVAYASGSPDTVASNDTAPVALTVVKGASCNVVPNPASLVLGPDAQSPHLRVIANCAWIAQSTATWITLTGRTTGSSVSGSGDETLVLNLAANTTRQLRTGQVTIGGQVVSVAQAGVPCTYAVNPPTLSTSAAAQVVQFTLTTQTGCQWTASDDGTWLGVSPQSGSGSATITATLQANTTAAVRMATLFIGNQAVRIAQSGVGQIATTPARSADPCTAMKLEREGDQIAPAGLTGAVSFMISVDSNCTWSAVSNVAWVTLTSARGGSGNGVVSYVVEPNAGSTTRTGSISVGEKSFTIHQAIVDSRVEGSSGGDSGGDGGSSGGSGGGSSGGGAG